MKILAIDSASSGCHACLWENRTLLAVKSEEMMRGQDSRLVPLVEELMAEVSLRYNDLDRIAVTRGPGSFTGLRVGLSTARGFGLAAEKPVIGIDRFSIYKKLFAKEKGKLFVIIESRRKELFVKFFDSKDDSNFNHETAQMLTPNEIKTLVERYPDSIVVGDAQDILGGVVDEKFFRTSEVLEVVACAQLAEHAKEGEPSFLPRPLYVRAPDVTLPKKKV